METIEELKKKNEELNQKIKESEEHVIELKNKIEDQIKEYNSELNDLQNKRKTDLDMISALNKKLLGRVNKNYKAKFESSPRPYLKTFFCRKK